MPDLQSFLIHRVKTRRNTKYFKTYMLRQVLTR